MQNDLKGILQSKNITTVFQPIFDINKQTVLGYEALSRGPVDSIYHRPDHLFSRATELGLLSELEILCRDNAINQFAQLGLSGKLFLNISPLVLLDKTHPQGETKKLVEQAGLSCDQIVIELSEKYPLPDANMLCLALEKYREFGFDVAIDDLGAGYSSLKMWGQLCPNIVKVDRYFVENCHQDAFKRKFLSAILALAQTANASVILEGIEHHQEYQILLDLGLEYAQGFYLARPEPIPVQEFPIWLQGNIIKPAC